MKSLFFENSFLIRRVLEVLIGTQIVLGLLQQWIFPSVMNSLIPFSEMHLFKGLERLLKLAVRKCHSVTKAVNHRLSLSLP